MKFYTSVACQGNHIYYRGIDRGRRVNLKMEYAPSLFVHSNAPEIQGRKYWKTLKGETVDVVDFPSIREAKDFLKRYEHVDGFQVYGNPKFEYVYIADQHPEETMEWSQDHIVTAFIDIETGSEHGMPNVETCQSPITAITVKFSTDPTYYVFGCGQYTPHRTNIDYLWCGSEEELLGSFMALWKEKSPDIITGWNVKTFDIPYLVGRICVLPKLGEPVARWLSPWGKVSLREETFYGKPQRVYHLLGCATLDYLQLFRKYAKNASQESYKLDHIAHVELKERKLDYSEHDSLHKLYLNDYQKFIEYNIKDVELVERLNAKGRLIDMALTLAYDNKTNYDDVFTQVRMWDVICYNHLRRKGIVIPPKKDTEKESAYEGAYVKDPQLGLFEWVESVDLDSLYPHLIMQYNMSPETLIDPNEYTDEMWDVLSQCVNVNSMLEQKIDLSKLKHCTLTPNGQFFRTDHHGFLAEIMQTMYNRRVIFKTKQLEAEKERERCKDPVRRKELDALISRYENIQLAIKVGLNSAYGAMGNEHFRFFDIHIAEAVTLAGQLSIRWVEARINTYLNTLLHTREVDYVIASDTDSLYIHLGPLVKKVFADTTDKKKIIDFMDKVHKEKIQGVIVAAYDDLASYVHAYEQKMKMKRESLADKAIWTAKKRYILNVWDKEGVRYEKPKLKIQGLEAIKSSTPSACRDKIKSAIEIIMNSTEEHLITFIETFKKEFNTLPIQDIAFPRGVNGLEEYRNKDGVAKDTYPSFMGFCEGPVAGSEVYESGTPIHVKGSLLYNHFLSKMGLDQDYDIIRSGDKIKFIYLREPNTLGTHVISFLVRIPKEFQLETIVDYDLQFQKSFVEPLNIILDSIGWRSERTSTLEGFFS
jgi:DNA polymerase elongation subunit (family B)